MKRLRRSMLFCPANNPKLLLNASLFKPDCIIFDLEDSVEYTEKDSARNLLAEALKVIDFEKCEIFARVNALSTPFGREDVKVLVSAGLRNIRLPMTETKEDVMELSEILDHLETEFCLEKNIIRIQCSIESPLGVYNAYEIATASPRLTSISFGAEDYTRLLGVDRTDKGECLLYPRSKIAMISSLVGIDAIDTVWSDLDDTEGFREEVKMAKKLGFSGKSCIHPSQIDVIHSVYTPDRSDVDKSIGIMKEVRLHGIENGGVILVDGKMVDKPVIEKAKRIVELARGSGLIKEE